ncbi:MAG TPA: DUF1501 domain-containing protein [Gemmataceae bacterium]|nr:DUF1501 domain-containing protein [Gemmataceae bacterium]
MSRSVSLSRRDWFRLSAAGVIGYSLSGWLETMAADFATDPRRRRSCILLWMNGGPSQMDTFDLKPGHANGGPFKEIQTSIPGIRISEHLPRLAKNMEQVALIRSMRTKEADHGRASYLLRTGRVPGGPVQYPTLGSVLSKELGHPDAELPNFVSIAPFRGLSPAAYGPGFLGPQYAPLIVGENANNFGGPPSSDSDQALRVEDLALPEGVNQNRAAARVQLLDEMEQDFLGQRASAAALTHRTAYQRAVTLMRSSASRAFNLEEEPNEVRDGYGRSLFGQGCLLARRLVERGVPFVEVTLSQAPGITGLGWDTHQNNFENVQKLSQVLDQAWSALLVDLRVRGLLDSTLMVWMGEFGRTPKIARDRNGRDHWANSWTTVLCGGGIRGGQVIGRTSPDGMEVEERPVAVTDFLATVGMALGVDVSKQNASNVGRPIRIVEPTAKPITEILA